MRQPPGWPALVINSLAAIIKRPGWQRPIFTVATGVDHLVDEFGVARQDAPVDRTGGGDDLAVAAQYHLAELQDQIERSRARAEGPAHDDRRRDPPGFLAPDAKLRRGS